MKNKILIGSLITSLCALVLYSTNVKRVENANLKIVDQNQNPISQTDTNKKVKSKQQVAEVEYPSDVKVESGSEKKWAQEIEQVMGKDQSYQVCVQDLNNDKYARVFNTAKTHDINTASRLFLLAALSYDQQHGNLSNKTSVKIKKSDQAKGEKLLQKGISYNAVYLKQLMMQGNKTAANALLRKVKPSKVNEVIHKMDATNSKITGDFLDKQIAVTTAQDLSKIMLNLYQDKVLSRQYSNQVLGALNLTKTKPKIVGHTKGLIYGIGDTKTNVAIVQSKGNAYCISVWSDNDRDFLRLGATISSFFK